MKIFRADRQPEFTQIDCEMAFITQEDILNTFEGLIRHLFKNVKGIDLPSVPRMFYDDAMKMYGSDKPDTRFDMKFVEITELTKGKKLPGIRSRGTRSRDQRNRLFGIYTQAD